MTFSRNRRPVHHGATCPRGGEMRLSTGRGRLKGPGSSSKVLVFCTCMAEQDRPDIHRGQWNYDHIAVIQVTDSALTVYAEHCREVRGAA